MSQQLKSAGFLVSLVPPQSCELLLNSLVSLLLLLTAAPSD